MKQNCYFKLFIFILLINIFSSTASGNQKLMWVYVEFPPVFSTNAVGKPEGELVDIGSKVLERAGYQWDTVSYPVKRMVDELIKGRVNLWIGLATLPQFKDTTFTGDSDIIDITLCSYYIGKKEAILKKEDLNGKTIIILRGYSYGGWINYIEDPANNIKFYEVNEEHETAFKMLKAGRADYLLDYTGPSEKVLKKIDIPDLNYNIISSFSARFVVSRKTPDAEQVLDRLEKAYKELVEEGLIVKKAGDIPASKLK